MVGAAEGLDVSKRRASSLLTAGFLLMVAMPGAAHAADPTVTMVASAAYEPPDVTTTVGGTVTWINRDTIVHDALDNYGKWRTPLLQPNEQASITFNAPGTYAYRCSLHPGMRATVTVIDDAPATDTVPAASTTADGNEQALIAAFAGLIGLAIAARRFRRPAISR